MTINLAMTLTIILRQDDASAEGGRRGINSSAAAAGRLLSPGEIWVNELDWINFVYGA